MDPLPATSDRIAPGPLALLQEFLNTAATDPGDDDLRIARAIRRDHAEGDSQSAIAARYGVSQQLVSAVLRGKRLVTSAPSAPGEAPLESLGTPASTSLWLAARGFLAPSQCITPADHARLLEARALFLALALANNGEPLSPDVPSALDGLAASVPLTVSLSSAPRLAAGEQGAQALLGALFAAVYDAMRDGSWSRLKACPADRCQHVFYDTSRNRTSTWCSMAVCGNRAKVRNYQQRRRTAIS